MYNSISQINYKSNKKRFSKKILNFLQYCDGKNRLREISKYIKLNINETYKIYKVCKLKI